MPSELRSRRLAPDDEEGDAELMASYVTVEDASAVPSDDSSGGSRAREQKRGLDGDGVNVLVLLFLYILQASLIVVDMAYLGYALKCNIGRIR